MDKRLAALALHREHRGKFEITSKISVKNADDLSLAYSPGVAEPCMEIAKHPAAAYEYTAKGNMIAIVSNGTAVLGLGHIGPDAAIPVMEGKAILFKQFAGIDAIPLCIRGTEPDEVVETVKRLEPSFGGINLEDIAAPACFEIENRLKREMGIPVFHDDQHGTAIVTLAALMNGVKLTGRSVPNTRIVVNGAGAAGLSITRLLVKFGFRQIILADRTGAIYSGRAEGMNTYKQEIAELTNAEQVEGSLEQIIQGADVFIGVSAAGVLSESMVRSMARDSIIFALSNPDPEILPEAAWRAGAGIVCTGRSDYPNQVNNVLAFPGIFRGALNARAAAITDEMKIAAAAAIAGLVPEGELSADYIIPGPFDERVVHEVAEAVARAALVQM
ncbi:NAD(P)-dependent malic enzyme [Paenibacillus fonticola]|uniref:NAD(P)-dependent malic enzyme n=1 Tax=Paenibacillus fonticola TaxID=379896 RepID=UPI003B8490BD